MEDHTRNYKKNNINIYNRLHKLRKWEIKNFKLNGKEDVRNVDEGILIRYYYRKHCRGGIERPNRIYVKYFFTSRGSRRRAKRRREHCFRMMSFGIV